MNGSPALWPWTASYPRAGTIVVLVTITVIALLWHWAGKPWERK